MFSVWQLPIKTKWTQIDKCCPFWSSVSTTTIVLIWKQSNLSWNTCNLKRIFKLKSRKSMFWNLDKTLTLVPNVLHLRFSVHLSFILNSPVFFLCGSLCLTYINHLALPYTNQYQLNTLITCHALDFREPFWRQDTPLKPTIISKSCPPINTVKWKVTFNS